MKKIIKEKISKMILEIKTGREEWNKLSYFERKYINLLHAIEFNLFIIGVFIAVVAIVLLQLVP